MIYIHFLLKSTIAKSRKTRRHNFHFFVFQTVGRSEMSRFDELVHHEDGQFGAFYHLGTDSWRWSKEKWQKTLEEDQRTKVLTGSNIPDLHEYVVHSWHPEQMAQGWRNAAYLIKGATKVSCFVLSSATRTRKHSTASAEYRCSMKNFFLPYRSL